MAMSYVPSMPPPSYPPSFAADVVSGFAVGDPVKVPMPSWTMELEKCTTASGSAISRSTSAGSSRSPSSSVMESSPTSNLPPGFEEYALSKLLQPPGLGVDSCARKLLPPPGLEDESYARVSPPTWGKTPFGGLMGDGLIRDVQEFRHTVLLPFGPAADPFCFKSTGAPPGLEGPPQHTIGMPIREPPCVPPSYEVCSTTAGFPASHVPPPPLFSPPPMSTPPIMLPCAVSQTLLDGPPAGLAAGCSELPTVGSAGHSDNTCKPCAFMHKPQGCERGVGCPFCHLCDVGAILRRRKEKRAALNVRKRGGNAVIV